MNIDTVTMLYEQLLLGSGLLLGAIVGALLRRAYLYFRRDCGRELDERSAPAVSLPRRRAGNPVLAYRRT